MLSTIRGARVSLHYVDVLHAGSRRSGARGMECEVEA